MQAVILDPKGQERASYRIVYGARLKVDEGSTVKRGDRLAEWNPNTLPVLTDVEGVVKYEDLISGVSMRDVSDEKTGVSNKVVIDSRVGTGAKAQELRPTMDYKNKRRVIVKPKSDKVEPTEYLIPKGKHISVREGDYVEKGDYIVEGNPSPHDILRIKGMEELATYLVKEIQDVYRLQGVKINDKHIEVICRQMMQKLEITEGGETTLLAGEQVDQLELEEANQKAIDAGAKIAEGRPVLLGITKASLQTRSVFSAASFQETTRVLTDAAVNGKVDTLEGLKENVIVGRLIPAGTGGAIARLRHIATERDKAIQEEQAKKEPVAQIEGPVAAE
jgi:DNA-directed RNA polymerase subunit beta'